MKRLLAFLFISVSALVFTSFSNDSKIFSCPQISQICMISSQKYDEKNFLQVIQNGGQFYYLTQDTQIANTVKNYDGVVLYFDDSTLDYITNFYKISYFQGQNVENYKIFYGYTSFFDKSVYVQNKKVNVQIAITENQIIVGFPIILTGF